MRRVLDMICRCRRGWCKDCCIVSDLHRLFLIVTVSTMTPANANVLLMALCQRRNSHKYVNIINISVWRFIVILSSYRWCLFSVSTMSYCWTLNWLFECKSRGSFEYIYDAIKIKVLQVKNVRVDKGYIRFIVYCVLYGVLWKLCFDSNSKNHV